MPVTLSADIPQAEAFLVGAGATSAVTWTYDVLDTSGVGGIIATSPTWSTRPEQEPALALTARVPVGYSGLALTVAYTYLDANLAVLSTGTADSFTATSATATRTVSPPSPPDGARYWYVQLVLNEGVSEIVSRSNLFPNPRGASTADFSARNSWTLSAPYTTGSAPVTGLSTAVRAQCAATATGTYRGVNIYQAVDGTTPTAGVGLDVSALVGQTITVSTYVLSTKAATFSANVRFFSGTTWTAAATAGTGVAVTAGSWSRVSATVTVPSGAAYLCASVWAAASTAWTVTTDAIHLTGVLIETASSVGNYFDGTYNPTGGAYSIRWNGTANASTSDMYTPGQPRNRSLVLTDTAVHAEAIVSEILTATLTRPLRRTVYDALNEAAPQISIGTPGLLAGSISYLCDTLEDALALDGIYQFAGAITLTTGGKALDGFTHMAVGEVRMAAEKATPGYESRWTVQAEVREIEESI